jgi:hypothetical protein
MYGSKKIRREDEDDDVKEPFLLLLLPLLLHRGQYRDIATSYIHT